MNSIETIARSIRLLRNAKDWTQAKLAEEAGMSVRGIQEIEAGKKDLRATSLAQIARALGVTEAQLFSEPQKEQSQDMHPQQLASQIAKELDRIRPNSPNQELSSEDQELLDLFRALAPDRRSAFLKTLRTAAGHHVQNNPKLGRG